jgi:hypothetical protein
LKESKGIRGCLPGIPATEISEERPRSRQQAFAPPGVRQASKRTRLPSVPIRSGALDSSKHFLKLPCKLLAAFLEFIQAAVQGKGLRVQDDAFEIGVVVDGLIVGID